MPVVKGCICPLDTASNESHLVGHLTILYGNHGVWTSLELFNVWREWQVFA